MEEINKLENYEHYWELINAIAELCDNAMENGYLYVEDVISALDRVKFHWIVDHIEIRFGLTPKEDENENERETEAE